MKVTQNRFDLLDTVQVDTVDEKDLLSSKFRDFDPIRRVTYHRVIVDEKRRPDLVSNREYGSPGLWWFVLKANRLMDSFDVPEGELLEVPNELDFFDFVREQRSS